MADEQHDDPRRPRPHPQTMAAPFLEFDLTREIDQLQREPRPASGQNAKTLAKHDDFRIVLITLAGQARIPDHGAEGRISVHTVRGHIRIRALERTFDLSAGGLLVLDQGLPHDVEALEDSALLLTIAWPAGTGAAPAPAEPSSHRRSLLRAARMTLRTTDARHAQKRVR